MRRGEFGRAVDALGVLQGDNARLWTDRIEQAFGQGIYVVEKQGKWGLTCCGDGTNPAQTRTGGNLPALSVLHPGVFNQSLRFLANVLVHENAHAWEGWSRPASRRKANRVILAVNLLS